MYEPKAKWPKYLIVPSTSQFAHNAWVDFDEDKEKDDGKAKHLSAMADRLGYSDSDYTSKEKEELAYHCGTSCCLVGWACLAFDEDGCDADDVENPATVEFLNKFLELAGEGKAVRNSCSADEDDSQFSLRVSLEASALFEGLRKRNSVSRVAMTPRRARALWVKTGNHFGYDTSNLIG